MSVGERRALIEPGPPHLSLSRQCHLLGVSRSSLYHEPKGESEENRGLMRRIDELFLEYPFYGSRQMARHLRREGVRVGRHRVRRLTRLMGLETIYQKPRTSRPHPEHRVYPYLLKRLAIERPNHVWTADITYIPVHKGFLYLVAVMDWATRRVLTPAEAYVRGLPAETRKKPFRSTPSLPVPPEREVVLNRTLAA
ncbi:MAG: IS3 family transposase [Deltaproteobacteria bacterium]|nr:IS3 family transposase [Deltaproteobacteria bacterium]